MRASLRKWFQPLPSKLVDPRFQAPNHGSLVAVVPQAVETLFQHVGLEQFAVQRKQPIQFLPFHVRQIQPAR
jgi:hypothetical protein